MKSVFGYATKIIFYVFVAAILVWTGSLTVSFVGRVLPGSQVEPFLALAVFDGGAFAWLMVFLFMASGLGQRAVALILLVLDLIGVGLMSISELLLGGQTLTAAPAQLGMVAVWGIGLWTFINVCAAYAFHVLDPKEQEEIQRGVAMDKVKDKALHALDLKLNQLGDELAEELGESMKAEALRSMGLRDRPALPWNDRAAGLAGMTSLAIPGTTKEKRQPDILEGATVSPNGHRPAA